jgi:PUA-like domain
MKAAAASLAVLGLLLQAEAFAPAGRIVPAARRSVTVARSALGAQRSSYVAVRMSAAASPPVMSATATQLTPPHGGKLVDLMLKDEADKKVSSAENTHTSPTFRPLLQAPRGWGVRSARVQCLSAVSRSAFASHTRQLSLSVNCFASCTKELTLNARQLCDVELLCNGGLSPLTGFMTEEEYKSVVSIENLQSHTLRM